VSPFITLASPYNTTLQCILTFFHPTLIQCIISASISDAWHNWDKLSQYLLWSLPVSILSSHCIIFQILRFWCADPLVSSIRRMTCKQHTLGCLILDPFSEFIHINWKKKRTQSYSLIWPNVNKEIAYVYADLSIESLLYSLRRFAQAHILDNLPEISRKQSLAFLYWIFVKV